MTWLGGAMDHQLNILSMLLKEMLNGSSIADINGHMPKARKRRDKLACFPIDRCIRAKEIFAHVVVYAENVKALIVEKLHRLATDKP